MSCDCVLTLCNDIVSLFTYGHFATRTGFTKIQQSLLILVTRLFDRETATHCRILAQGSEGCISVTKLENSSYVIPLGTYPVCLLASPRYVFYTSLRIRQFVFTSIRILLKYNSRRLNRQYRALEMVISAMKKFPIAK